ncbi:hypothetical protein D9M68_904360 [compost metagenome]
MPDILVGNSPTTLFDTAQNNKARELAFFPNNSSGLDKVIDPLLLEQARNKNKGYRC